MFNFNKPATQTTSTFGSFGQTQQTPAFGQANTTGAFGSGGTFGQSQPQQTSLFGSSTPSFGGGASTANAFGTPFGAKPATPSFGSTAPSTPFGQTSAGAFGSATSTPSFSFGATNTAFGQQNTGNSFGSGGGIFGAANQNKEEFPPDSIAGVPIPTNGSTVPFQVQQKRDMPLRKLPNSQTEAPYDANQDNMHSCQHIGFQKEYWNISPEELRWQDYQQNRKAPQPGTVAPQATPFTFGQPQAQATPGGLFGSATTTQASPFGANPTNTFGQASTSTGGLFGNKPATSNAFSSPTPAFGATPTPTPFSFSNATPQTSFGQPTANTSPFGGAQAGQPAPGGLFGQATAAPTTGGLFGNPQTTAPTFSFGQNQQTPAQPKPFQFGTGSTGGGLFGNATATTSTPAFGATPTQPTSTGFNFGAANNTTTSTPLFGGAQQTTSPAPFGGGGLFGNNNATANKPLFGGALATPTTGFGAPTQPTSTFSFNKPTQPTTGGGLFSSFGNAQPPAQNATPLNFGGTAQQTGGMFNSTLQQPGALGQSGGLFGGLGQTTTQPPPSNDANPYGSNPLFSQPAGTPAKAPFYSPAEPQAKIKPALASLPVRATPKAMGKITRLRFAPSSNTNTPNFNRMSNSPSSLLLNNGRNSPTLTMGLGDTVLSPNAFISKQSVKRLDLTHRASSSDLRDRSASQEPSAKPKVQWNPELEMATPKKTSTPVSVAKSLPQQREISRSPTTTLLSTGEASEYVFRPSLEELEQYSADQLSSVEGFEISRPGYGKIEFLEPVDLTTVPSLRSIAGDVVKIANRELQVYPSGDVPEAGQGLNVPAVISLENSWPRDKCTNQPEKTTDPARIQKAVASLKKRCAKLGSTFIDFDAETGVWSFKVLNF